MTDAPMSFLHRRRRRQPPTGGIRRHGRRCCRHNVDPEQPEKSHILLPGGVGADSLTAAQQVVLDETGLVVAKGGRWILGVPVGREQCQREFARERMRGEPTELLRALAPVEDAPASFQILRLTAAAKTAFRTIRPDMTTRAAEESDKHYEWALASIIA